MNQSLKELVSIYRTAVSRAGVSENEFWIWYALLMVGGEYAQQDICALWSLPKQTANTIISGMVKKGYVTLETAPGARNRKLIRMTRAGRSYGESVVLPIYNAEQRSLQKLPEADRALCRQVLARYIRILKDELLDSPQKS